MHRLIITRIVRLREHLRYWLLRWRHREEVKWQILQNEGRPVITRNGKPFRVQGVTGWDLVRLDDLVDIGGNAIRAQPDLKGLNEAAKRGIHVVVNLPVEGERTGFDWDDAAAVKRQNAEVLKLVGRLKNHPAVMMWSVGNELDHVPQLKRQGLRHNQRLWEHQNSLARAVKEIDPDRLVTLCVGIGVQIDKLVGISADCPDIDLLGINAFVNMEKVFGMVNEHWGKPFFLSEWGPNPPWNSPATAWEAPRELTSSQKAALVSHRYKNTILPEPNCVGSFLFYWGERNERTHTWFGLFRDGMKTETLDVMKRHWTGEWPARRTPSVLGLSIEGHKDVFNICFKPGQRLRANLHCSHPPSTSLHVEWHIREEVYRPLYSYSGHREPHTGPIDVAIKRRDERSVDILTPAEPGAYRLYVQVHDHQGNAGYANVPFLVESEQPQA